MTARELRIVRALDALGAAEPVQLGLMEAIG